VGSGKVARIHAAALKSLAESELVAVCGRPSAGLEAFGASHGVPVFHGRRRDGAEGGRAGAQHLHQPPPARGTCDSGCESWVHVLVEKPLATTLASATG